MPKLPQAFRRIAFAVGLMTVASSPASAQIEIPRGWRPPTSLELNPEWRNRDPARYAVVSGDFNGDGIVDQSMLLVSTRKQGFALFVFISHGRHKFKTYKLDAKKDLSLFEVTGIVKVSPGTYRSACGKGYWACVAGEPADVSIKYDSIKYFKEESAVSYFHWDRSRNKFRRIWISD